MNVILLMSGRGIIMNNLIISINGIDHEISIDGNDSFYKNDKKYNAEIKELNPYAYLVTLGNEVYEVTVSKNENDDMHFTLDGYTYNVNIKTQLDMIAGELFNSSQADSDVYLVKAPMPGMIVKINVEKGMTVEKGSPLLSLEAMKMENIIKSDYKGIVEDIYCKEEESVDKKKLLIKVKIESQLTY